MKRFVSHQCFFFPTTSNTIPHTEEMMVILDSQAFTFALALFKLDRKNYQVLHFPM